MKEQTRCAKCGKPCKENGGKWGIHKQCEDPSAKVVAKKLNARL